MAIALSRGVHGAVGRITIAMALREVGVALKKTACRSSKAPGFGGKSQSSRRCKENMRGRPGAMAGDAGGHRDLLGAERFHQGGAGSMSGQ